MGEQVHVRPSHQIEPRPRREKIEACLRQFESVLAPEHGIESLAQRMKMQDIGGGISELSLGKRLCPPIGRLALLGEIDTEQLAREIFEPVPIGVGPRDLRGDLRAIDRRGHDTEGREQNRYIESREMEQLGDSGVGKKALQVRRPALPGRDLHDISGTVAARHLDNAKPVSSRDEAECLRIYCDAVAEEGFIGQVTPVQANSHSDRS